MKLPFKKLVISSVTAASLLVIPQLSGSASAATLSTTHQILNKGDVGQSVEAVQEKLHGLGLYNDSIDGIYGVNTRSAVRKYQSSHGLVVDGIAGPHTLGSMFGSAATTKAATSATSTKSTNAYVNHGDRGQAVKNVQTKLKSLGYLKGSVDGIFGPQTESAVKSFQRAHHLTADGVVGPKTESALSSAKASTTSDIKQMSYTVSKADAVINDAKKYMGVPYKFGGESPSGFDCSGFVQYIFEKNGISIARTTSAQYSGGTHVSTPQKGDLVFFETYKAGPSHVGIYIGNGQFIEASSSHGITIDNMNSSYWKPKYLGARSYF